MAIVVLSNWEAADKIHFLPFSFSFSARSSADFSPSKNIQERQERLHDIVYLQLIHAIILIRHVEAFRISAQQNRR